MVSICHCKRGACRLPGACLGDALGCSLAGCEWLEWPAWDWQHLNVVNVRNHIRDSGDRHDGRIGV